LIEKTGEIINRRENIASVILYKPAYLFQAIFICTKVLNITGNYCFIFYATVRWFTFIAASNSLVAC